MNVLNFLFFSLILFFPIGELGKIQIFNEVSITLNDFLVGLIAGIWYIFYFFDKILFSFNNKIIIAFGIFICTAIISLIVNITNYSVNQIFISSLYIFRLISYASLFPVLLSFDENTRKKVLYLMVFSGSVVVIGGYMQYFFYPDLRNLYYAGWDEHLYRMFSSFLDPNFLGAFLVLYLVFLTGLFLIKKKEKQSVSLFILAVIIAMTILAIFLTYSRGALIMFAVSSVLFLLLQKKLLWILALVIIIFFGIYFSPGPFQSEGTNILRTASGIARIESARNALKIISDNPVFGVGFNSYRYAQIRYGFLKEKEGEVSHSGAGTDNSFLFILATTGIAGFAAFIFLLYKIFIDSLGGIKSSDFYQRTVSTVVIASLGGLIVNSFFLNSLFYPFVMAWMWIIFGLSSSRTIKAKVNKKR